MNKSSIMGNLADIFTLVEDKVKAIKNPDAKLKFINGSIGWIKIILNLLNQLKIEIQEGN